jgi:hypothetical protein
VKTGREEIRAEVLRGAMPVTMLRAPPFDARSGLCHGERVMANKSDLKRWSTTIHRVVGQRVPCDFGRPVGVS